MSNRTEWEPEQISPIDPSVELLIDEIENNTDRLLKAIISQDQEANELQAYHY